MISNAVKFAVLASMLALSPLAAPAVMASGQGVVVLVNDAPLTEFDITQRIALLRILGDTKASSTPRKKILQMLVDEQVKLSEAKKHGFTPTDAEVTAQIARVSKGMGTTTPGLMASLKKQGISEASFRSYINAQIGFNRLISTKNRQKITVTPADVDRKFAEIKSQINKQVDTVMRDPRMKPVTVYSLLEISLPVEGDDSGLLQARAVEAAQLAQRINGCGNVRGAAEGIFNVKIGKKIEADGAKLPKQMKAALDKAGPGRAVGPMRGKGGIQLLAFCGTRKLVPPKPKIEMPTRQQVENALLNEKYDGLEEQYLKTARSSLYVEYRDQSYAP